MGGKSSALCALVGGLALVAVSGCTTVLPGPASVAPTGSAGPAAAAQATVSASVETTTAPIATVTPDQSPKPTKKPRKTAAPATPTPAGPTEPPTPSPGVNLVVTDAHFSPDETDSTSLIHLFVTIRNSGSLPAVPFTISVGFSNTTSGGGALKPIDVPDVLNPGDEKQYQANFTLDPETWTFRIRADSGDLMEEDSEDDNRATAELTVDPGPPGPNLVWTECTLTPNTASINEAIQIDYTIANIGTEPATGIKVSHGWRLGNEADNFPDFDVIDLAAGESSSAIGEVYPDAAGTYTYWATVDPTNLVAESHEDDNEATVDATITP